MEIREIDPNDPVFRNLKQEGVPGKLNLSGKFALPGFLQKREQINYQPAPRVVAAPLPPPEPQTVIPPAPPQPAQLPQVRVKVPPLPPQPASVVISPRRHPIHPLPQPKPPEPQELDPELEEMIREGPPYTARPEPVPAPTYTAENMDSAAIYGTTAPGTGFHLPSIKLPSFRRAPPEIDVDDMPAVREITRSGFNWEAFKKILPQFIVGIICVYFGLTSTGSYYQPASRFSGELATVFYGYQLGTLIVVLGCFLVYDAFRKAGKI